MEKFTYPVRCKGILFSAIDRLNQDDAQKGVLMFLMEMVLVMQLKSICELTSEVLEHPSKGDYSGRRIAQCYSGRSIISGSEIGRGFNASFINFDRITLSLPENLVKVISCT